MSEPRAASGWSGAPRWLQSWLKESYHRHHAAFVLAIGGNGPSWFTSVGYSAEKAIPFAYFISPPHTKTYVPPPTDQIRVGYLGRLVKVKGVFDLLDALTLLGDGATLTMAGAGIEEDSLKAKCVSAGINATFRGVLPIAEVNDFFREIDVLVLASTTSDDGWGVVVSEALMCGVPVIATSAVGASIVLDRQMFGRCVAPHNPKAIAAAIKDLRETGAFEPKNRCLRAIAASKTLSAHAGAEYLMRVISWNDGRTSRPLDFYENHDD